MTILLVEDHKPTRNEVRALIEGQPDMRVVAESSTGEDAVIRAREWRPDVVVIDIFLPGMNGVEATRLICAEQPAVRVLALSNHFGASLVQAIQDAGGLGYVRKSRAFEELVPAIRTILSGRQYLGRQVTQST
ncbi:MAG: response regulator transcription factor [bacterium]